MLAEIELSVLSRQGPDRRVPDFETLQAEVGAWQQRRNDESVNVDWRFTTEDARIRFKRLHASLEPVMHFAEVRVLEGVTRAARTAPAPRTARQTWSFIRVHNKL